MEEFTKREHNEVYEDYDKNFFAAQKIITYLNGHKGLTLNIDKDMRNFKSIFMVCLKNKYSTVYGIPISLYESYGNFINNTKRAIYTLLEKNYEWL